MAKSTCGFLKLLHLSACARGLFARQARQACSSMLSAATAAAQASLCTLASCRPC